MEFSAQMENLHSILEWILKELKGMKFDASSLNKLEVGCEEAIVNIIKHAYKEGGGKIDIEVKSFPRSHVEIVITDSGPPFNPLTQKRIDSKRPLEEWELGGLGIPLIHKIMDKVSYRRHGDKNVLILIKKAKAFFY